MVQPVKVVDLFAGPGGLGEGFWQRMHPNEKQRAFGILVSAERDPAALETLRLRSWYRSLVETGNEERYYRYLEDRTGSRWRLPEMIGGARLDERVVAADLGTPDGDAAMLEAVREGLTPAERNGSAPWVLIGGPPCQAYSLAGRSRNRGIEGYEPSRDTRHFLYQTYLVLLARMRPAVFVLENVKGILSSRVGETRVFPTILSDLSLPDGARGVRYVIRALSTSTAHFPGADSIETPHDFVVDAADHGVPQKRQRVILVGIREDVHQSMPAALRDAPLLTGPRNRQVVTVRDAIGEMHFLRSRLSTGDSPRNWAQAVALSARKLCRVWPSMPPLARDILESVPVNACSLEALPVSDSRPHRGWAFGSGLYHRFVIDRRLPILAHHEARGHMAADLMRYLFVSAAGLSGSSPRSRDFPAALAPAHGNWNSGHFDDRFRVQRWDEPASTVTSHLSKDGPHFIHPDPWQCRSLTVREAARLQSFPDNYLFAGTRTQQYVQVGNAVPPLLGRAIAGAVLRILCAAPPASAMSGCREADRVVADRALVPS